MIFLVFVSFVTTTNFKLIAKEASSQHLVQIFSSQGLRQEFSGFLSNVLKQAESREFYKLVDNVFVTELKYDCQLYDALSKKIHTIMPSFKMVKQLQALSFQKKTLTKQVRRLLPNKKSVNGCLEIGTPSTYFSSLAHYVTLNGPLYAMTEKRQFTDYVQSFAFNRHGLFPSYKHLSLQDYDPITSEIPDKSLDLVICFIGLHHIPHNKIDSFVNSIARVLRPGGIFILRDHDAKDEKTLHMVHAAHSVFNLMIPNLTLEEEIREYRNFQPLSYWITLLERHGLSTNSERLVQEGDPSLNTMLAFTKVAESQEEKDYIVAEDLKNNSGYQRDIAQTYLTSPEWHNVDVSQEYASFIEHTPFYEFPYMKSIQSYWDVFGKSFIAAKKRKGFFATAFSPYTLMNVFVGVTMSLEYSAKSVMSLPIRALYQGSEDSTLAVLVKDPDNELSTLKPQLKYKPCLHDATMKVIEMPRYKAFLPAVKRLASTAIQIYEIAGQKEIQIKICYPKDSVDLQSIEYCNVEYTWQLPTKLDVAYAAVTVPVNKLLLLVNKLPIYGIEIVYIHDF